MPLHCQNIARTHVWQVMFPQLVINLWIPAQVQSKWLCLSRPRKLFILHSAILATRTMWWDQSFFKDISPTCQVQVSCSFQPSFSSTYPWHHHVCRSLASTDCRAAAELRQNKLDGNELEPHPVKFFNWRPKRRSKSWNRTTIQIKGMQIRVPSKFLIPSASDVMFCYVTTLHTIPRPHFPCFAFSRPLPSSPHSTLFCISSDDFPYRAFLPADSFACSSSAMPSWHQSGWIKLKCAPGRLSQTSAAVSPC